jgi:hypothetical protein
MAWCSVNKKSKGQLYLLSVVGMFYCKTDTATDEKRDSLLSLSVITSTDYVNRDFLNFILTFIQQPVKVLRVEVCAEEL